MRHRYLPLEEPEGAGRRHLDFRTIQVRPKDPLSLPGQARCVKPPAPGSSYLL